MRAMLGPEEIERIRPKMMTLRIIVFAMFSGVTTFAIFAISMRGAEAFSPTLKLEPLSLVALFLAASSATLSFVLPGMLARASAINKEAAKPANTDMSERASTAAAMLQTGAVVGCALLEGAAFLNLIAVYLGAGGLMHLLLAIALALTMLVHFPFTEGDYVDRVERKLPDCDEMLN